MGWALNDCGQGSRNCSNYLVVQYSPSNSEGTKAIYSFAQYIKGKNPNLQVFSSNVENKNDLITITYYSGNKNEVIYSGNNLNQSIFDSLYEKII